MTLDTVVRCRFLGHAQIEIAHTLVTPEAERLFALLAVLASEAGTARHRDDLAVLLWSDQPEERGKHNLRQTLYKARQLGVQVVTTGEEVVLPASAVWCDWRQGDTPVHGEWLGAYTGSFSDPFASWVVSTRVVVHASLRPRLVAAMEAARASGDLRLAEQHATQLLRLDPLNEEATLVLAECAAMAGSKVDAMRLLDEYIAEVGEERDMAEAVLPAKVLRTRIAERLPVATYATGEVHDLPLVGREAELQQLLAALFDIRGGRGGVTWVWGPEGIGKSRLVHEVLKAAAMQGVRVARVAGTGERGAGWAGFVALVERLVGMPGALGTSPEALGVMRGVAETLRAADTNTLIPEGLVPALVDLLSSLSHEAPILIVIDNSDVWTARATEALLSALDLCASKEVGAVFACRINPNELDRRTYSHPVRVIRMERLTVADLQSLLERRATALGWSNPQGRAAAPAMAADGNPLFALELFGKSLNHADGDRLPYQIRRVISQRISQTDNCSRRVLIAVWAHGGTPEIDFVLSATGVDRATAETALSMLLDSHLLAQKGKGYAASPFLDLAWEELLNAEGDTFFVVRCAEAIRNCFSRSSDGSLAFRSTLLLAMVNHRERAAEWIVEDLPQVLSCTKAGDILGCITMIESLVGLGGPLSVLGKLREEVASRAMANFGYAPALANHSALSTVLPPTMPEEAKFTAVCTRRAEYDSSTEKARDLSLSPIERVRAGCHAIILADNLRELALVEEAIALVETAASSGGVRQLDILRARMIAACSMGRREYALALSKELVSEARASADPGDSCRVLRNAAQVELEFGSLENAGALCHEALTLAIEHGYTAQAGRTYLDLAFVHFSRADAKMFGAVLDQFRRFASAHSLVTGDLAFDHALCECLQSVWDDNPSAGVRPLAVLHSFESKTESPLTHRQIESVRQFCLKRLPSGPNLGTVMALAESLGTYRPTEAEDRVALALIRASAGSEIEARVREEVTRYVKQKETLGYPASPLRDTLA